MAVHWGGRGPGHMSRGMGVGPELLANNEFANGATSWTVINADATHIATFSGGTLRYQSDTTSPQLVVQQTGVMAVGKLYRVTFVTSAYTSGTIKTDSFGSSVIIPGVVGTYSFYGVASATPFTFIRNSANVDLTLDSISIRLVTGAG